jgi:Uma2 family endonuclease
MSTLIADSLAIASSPPALHSDGLYEVVNGQRRELPPMGAFETSLAKVLLVLLDAHGIQNNLGEAYMEMLFLLDAEKDLQRRPDVAFVSYQRWPKGRKVPRTAAWAVVPNVAIEVVSPTNAWEEIMDKIHDYFASGVERVWVVSPSAAQVYVYTAVDANQIYNRADMLEDDAIAGLRLPLESLFA